MQLPEETTLSLEAIDKFRNSLYETGRSSQTIKAYTTDLKMLLRDLEVTELDHSELKATGLNWLQANRKKLAPSTTIRRRTSLQMYSAWIGKPNLFDGYIAPEPMRAMPHPLPEGVDGVRRLLEVAKNENQRALIAMCGLLGCRVAEALALSHSDFDLQTMTVTIRGKGDKTRRVPISKLAWTFLETPVYRSFIEQRETIVCMQDRPARRIITNLGKKANLQRQISSHDLRSTFATEVYNHTLDIRVTQELLGHSSSVTTEGYVGVGNDKLVSAVEFG